MLSTVWEVIVYIGISICVNSLVLTKTLESYNDGVKTGKAGAFVLVIKYEFLVGVRIIVIGIMFEVWVSLLTFLIVHIWV